MKRISIAVVASIAFAVILLSGCANYRLAGTPVKLPFSSVYVAPVKNESYAPQAANLLSNAIIFSINQTPSVKTAPEGEAQAVLETSIIDYRQLPVATSSTDTALAASYKMVATARCTLRRSNGEVIFKDMKVSADVLVYPGTGATNDLIGDSYQNMPVLMRELGVRVKDAVIGIW